MGKRSTARKLAMQIMFEFEFKHNELDSIFDETFSRDSFIDETRLFCKAIVSGIVEHQNMIDGLIRAHAIDWSFDRIVAIDKAILRTSIWELLFTDTSTKVIVAEAIELIKDYSQPEAIKFVNGILATIAKERPENVHRTD